MTVHPSYLLRLPDADAKAREYERFVDDLRIAAALLRKTRTRPKRSHFVFCGAANAAAWIGVTKYRLVGMRS